MIRIPPCACRRELFPALLAESLDKSEEAAMLEDLEHCPGCVKELERLSGIEADWKETASALAGQTLERTREFFHPASAASPEQVNVTGATCLPSLVPSLTPSSQADSIGCLDGYEIREQIGWGGMGVVLLAHDVHLMRPVALKVLHPHLAANGSARQRFSREARAAAAVTHAAVVPIHAVNAQHDPPYLVMAYIPGGSLQDRIDREGPLQLEEALRIAIQIADGLAAAHEQGLVHRDVKPANILLDHGQDRVLLSDFGLAQALDDAAQTCSGMIAGTPQYMSPEQASGQSIDARSDLFSLGGVIYAMLTGRPPFRGTSTLEVLRKIQTESPRPASESHKHLPIWIDSLLARFQCVKRTERIDSAQQTAALLRECLLYLGDPKRHPLPRQLTRLHPRQKLVRRLLLGLVGSAAMACMVAALTWPSSQGSPNDQSGSGSAVRTAPRSDLRQVRMEASDLEWNDGVDETLALMRERIAEILIEFPILETGETQ